MKVTGENEYLDEFQFEDGAKSITFDGLNASGVKKLTTYDIVDKFNDADSDGTADYRYRH